MEHNMLNIFLFNLINQAIVGVLLYIYVRVVLLRNIAFHKLFSVSMLFSVPYAALGGWFYLVGFVRQYPLTLNFTIEFLAYLITTMICHMVVKLNWRKSAVFAVSFQFVMSSAIYLTAIVQTNRYDLTKLYDFLRYTFDMFLFAPLLSVLIFWVLRRIRFAYLLNTLLKNEKKQTLSALLSCCFPFLYTWLSFTTNDKDYFIRGVYSILLTLAFLGFIRYLVMNEYHQAKLQAKEALLLQQQAYTERLEKMQEDMRIFRHDYKNKLSAMYLYAKDGESKPIQDFIQKSIDTIDESMTEEIRQTTHLAKICVIELKSLLLTKLMQMRKKEIPCNLEVSNAITTLAMDMDDLCRCVGILIDNAIEAVENQDIRAIDILINSTSSQHTFIIQNPAADTDDFHRIGEYGYSTKGMNRGLGLYSYHKILSQYDNVFPSTYLKNNCFIQELTIKEN